MALVSPAGGLRRQSAPPDQTPHLTPAASAADLRRGTLGPTGYAVIDTETTGFGREDRVIEVGVVWLDDDLQVTAEWDTLIDPGRDLGPQHIHHIRPGDVAGAPTFGQMAAQLVDRLAGRVIVGHNVSFDRRMLNQEFERLDVDRPLGREFSLDTLDWCRRLSLSPTRCYTLDHLCAVHRIERGAAHAALADARATGRLLALVADRLECPADPSQAWAEQRLAARQASWPALPELPFQRHSRCPA
ncbi:MAG: 3'-5' exonuclease [Propionibacteriaceae bacterium]|nr:3'-5' exonuclease [Propionibacteriaceae bacterium]